jgi:hypothetical protein
MIFVGRGVVGPNPGEAWDWGRTKEPAPLPGGGASPGNNKHDPYHRAHGRPCAFARMTQKPFSAFW